MNQFEKLVNIILYEETDIFLNYIKKERKIIGLLFDYSILYDENTKIIKFIQYDNRTNEVTNTKEVTSLNDLNNMLYTFVMFGDNYKPYTLFKKLYKIKNN